MVRTRGWPLGAESTPQAAASKKEMGEEKMKGAEEKLAEEENREHVDFWEKSGFGQREQQTKKTRVATMPLRHRWNLPSQPMGPRCRIRPQLSGVIFFSGTAATGPYV